MAATKDQYVLLLHIRPWKFDAEEVNYRKAEGAEKCEGCIHFFVRQADNYGVCEIYRDADNEQSIDPEYTCNFQTEDGKHFPLLDDAK